MADDQLMHDLTTTYAVLVREQRPDMIAAVGGALDELARLRAVEAERDRLREALEIVRDWRLPDSGRTWEDGSPMSYTAAWGSLGAEQFIREIAARALASTGQEPTP